jgi:hypothetical protein
MEPVMPLTEKGEKIKGAMEKQYGAEKGEKVFYASKNKGTITGVDDDERIPLEEGKSKETVSRNTNKLIEKGHNPEAAAGIAQRQASKSKDDDAQHMGFSGSQAEPIEKLVSQCDALAKRLDAFEKWSHQKKPKDVKPRTKDNMQPSNRHPKEVDR